MKDEFQFISKTRKLFQTQQKATISVLRITELKLKENQQLAFFKYSYLRTTCNKPAEIDEKASLSLGKGLFLIANMKISRMINNKNIGIPF